MTSTEGMYFREVLELNNKFHIELLSMENIPDGLKEWSESLVELNNRAILQAKHAERQTELVTQK